MKIVVAMDSFKGCLTSLAAGHAVEWGARKADPTAEVKVIGLADGGEGTADLLSSAMGGKMLRTRVTGPLGEPLDAAYGIVASKGLAVVEMAEAAGLPLVPEHRRDPLRTTTYGVGELICDALDRGLRQFILCLGGSATNDGALGALTALGARFYDANGAQVGIFGQDMCRVARADFSGLDPRLAACQFQLACDVNNPLCGPLGASAVFGPQKGATQETVGVLDAGLSRYADVLSAALGRDARNDPGAGAAGGMAYGFLQVLGAELRMGAELVLTAQNVDTALAGADIAITGEGKMDGQTSHGKGPAGFCRRAKAAGAITLALCGSIAAGVDNAVVDSYFSIQPGAVSLAEAMEPERAAENLSRTAEQAVRLYLAAK